MYKKILFFILIICIISCKSEAENLLKIKNTETINNFFTKIKSSNSKILFENNVVETNNFNFSNYRYIYNGASVSVGDVNNDGLIDVYFTSNQNTNKLYLNQGGFVFEDITKFAGIEDAVGWTTGSTMVDINNDGWLDIYVCKSGSLDNGEFRKNKLFINQKDNTFKEAADKWQLANNGFSNQSYFFDFDKDGDLDMYLVNHIIDFRTKTNMSQNTKDDIIKTFSNQLYRNDGEKYTNITNEAGVDNIAWGLSASVGDFNNDNWPDIYVCNDFLEPDVLYINNKNGTFTNKILDNFRHISFFSMGSDFADINNDLLQDLVVLDMTSSDHVLSKTNMASMSTSNFNAMVKKGFHHQYMFNTLQLNNGNNTFSDIGQMAKVSKTGWSWAPLLADFDNDGFKDLFVSNGIKKYVINRDFRIKMEENKKTGIKMPLNDILSLIPEGKLPNYIFHNNGDLTFKNTTNKWNLDEPSFSSGATYADLDNDGDLDLILNNMNEEAFIYKNNSVNNYLQIILKGSSKNPLAIGSKVYLYAGDKKQMQELYLSKGYLSTITNQINFGVKKEKLIDSVKIVWPDTKITLLKDIKSNQKLNVNYNDSQLKQTAKTKKESTLLTTINPNKIGINFIHKENQFNDYAKQVLLPHKQSQNGPFIAKSDVNKDGLIDVFIGGASKQSGKLYLQNIDGTFVEGNNKIFNEDIQYEDLGVLFFDFDNDNDDDLYIVSGGAEFTKYSKLYQDRLYINNGKGNFIKSSNILPRISTSGQTVIADDIDNDGDLDLFIGGRVIPNNYPFAPESLLLINENGKFINKTKELAPELQFNSMVSSALFTDYDNDGDKDLLIIGEWSKIQFFKNTQGKFEKTNITSLSKTRGLWFGLNEIDIDNDGDMDYFIGNLGLNAKFKTTSGNEFHVFCDDFDDNSTYDVLLSNKYKDILVPSRGKECSSQQMPFVSQKFPTYKLFAEANLEDIIGKEKLDNALHYKADILFSVFLKNNGKGSFDIIKLPNNAQLSPIQSFNFYDIDNDGVKEIICVGNIFGTEVETQRYDASYGTVLQYKNKKFSNMSTIMTGLSTSGNAKNNIIIPTSVGNYLFVTNNNGALDVFKLK